MEDTIEEKQVKRYREQISNLKKDYTFYDCHVHPYDVISEQGDYHPNPFDKSIYSFINNRFIPPAIGSVSLKDGIIEGEISDSKLLQKFIMMKGKQIYGHIGLKVLTANMDLSGIDQALLLQVAPREGDILQKMQVMNEIFGNQSRFKLAGSVPNFIKNDHISQYIKDQVQLYHIRALKLHPIITGIDLATNAGKERVERILSACMESQLPLIVHGGKSFLFANMSEANYSLMENFEKINWGSGKSIVVIAHAGCYDCELKDIENIIIPRLRKMLQRYDNMMIDISGLGFKALLMIIQNIEVNRILFGSDALYYSQWSAVVKLFYAFQKTVKNYEENFLNVMSITPAQTVFREYK